MDLTNALWITLIGMGLVFVAILMLWGLMALLVRVTAEREPADAGSGQTETAASAAPEAVEESAQLLVRKRKAAAAAAAVAVAMASTGSANGQKTSVTGRDPQSAVADSVAGALSAWQAVNRASLISRRSASTRKKVY